MSTFTLYLPDELVRELDEIRGPRSRSGWVRAAVESCMGQAPQPGLRSPIPEQKIEAPREPSVNVALAHELDPSARPAYGPLGISQRQLEERRQEEAGEV